ncbi:HAD family phosphatase [Aeromonas sp. BIGb0445]|uniref:HAD family hydrolase n=1 Tax=Aeromonas sp. BIGb0445 TaxID=2940593 RepID=UPI002168CBE4|nr:HAD family hydrolase [Aeromonas sp. BIGb0445]MCS3459642.1 phosphoglycolate phosphatase-like HAD superfamily hydrolase [Aeromonas sp. BIGb0445]
MKLNRILCALILGTAFCANAESVPDPLSAWQETAAKGSIKAWVAGATQAGANTFIPVNKRYVVFDNDGTLWPEAPLTFQLQFAIDEIKRLAPKHPEWQQDAIVKAVLANDMPALVKSGKKGLLQLLTLTHSDMTTEEYAKRVRHWLDNSEHPRFGCHYDQLAYLPMKQLLEYLRDNGFKTWIVSGGGIDFMRVFAEQMYGIPPEQVVGSFALGEFAVAEDGTSIRKTMKGAYYDDEAAKPAAIHLFMGQRPVGAFGNSDGDVPMLQYTTSNPDFKPFGLIVRHTDEKREYAYDSHPPSSGTLVEGLKLAPKYGWTVVDMKKDWKAVFDPAQCAFK